MCNISDVVLVSVIIPVKDGEAVLERCLNNLLKQTISHSIEIIILNSMSIDNSKEIALKFGARIIDIPDGTFDHGLTRNIGVKNAKGEFIFLTVQDAWIAKPDMLERMVKHFDDIEVMGVVGHQAVPHEKDKNPCVWYRPYSKPEVSEKIITNIDAFKSMAVIDQQSLIAWDDVVSMYRRSALAIQPFVETEFAEDWIWSYNALINGWKLIYDPSLLVYHYHHQTYRYAFNVTYTCNYHFYKFFRYKPVVPSIIKPMAQIMYHLLCNKRLTLREKSYWILFNWRSKWAVFFSTINFLIRLELKGESGIEMGYYRFCKSIPQGKQKN